MSLCYLHSKSVSYPHTEKLLSAFPNNIKLEIDAIDSLDKYDVYIIELNSANKEISLKLVNIFKKINHPLIYFIIPKNHTLLLFQLTFLLNTKSIITHNQDIDKFITKIHVDRDALKHSNFENWLGNVKLKTQNFIVYKNDNLIFVNKSLLTLFKCNDDSSFKQDVLSNVNIKKLLEKETVLLENISKINTTYEFRSVSVSEHEKIIYIKQVTHKEKNMDFISSRVSFIELLKENILQRDISDKSYSILIININIKQLFSNLNVVDLEDIVLNLLTFMESILKTKLIFSQFENTFYMVIFENIDFKQINIMAEHFYSQVLSYIDRTNRTIIVDLFTFDLKNQEFVKILTTLNSVSHNDFAKNHIRSKHIKHISAKDYELDAKTLLHNAHEDNQEVKILNIYNGLVINTSTKIIEVTKKYVYIRFEPLQGVILNLDKKTVLQSDTFTHDIYAELKQINLKKKIAILENFKFLKTNANSRKHARVTMPIKTPIAMNYRNNTVNGIIIDISIKSIAVKVKYTPKIAMMELTNSSLVFNILDETSENGYLQLNLDSKAIMVTNVDETGYYKVICDLNQESYDLDIVLKYVYERQKELIIELKRMAKLNEKI